MNSLVHLRNGDGEPLEGRALVADKLLVGGVDVGVLGLGPHGLDPLARHDGDLLGDRHLVLARAADLRNRGRIVWRARKRYG